uniref:protein-S-isoprenylcysteine alpha-carbonyl methylesterase n=1 Tax=Musa acuminata subsp. malaccensis TaxID=214687 RepID=A0A804I765_MUSAM|nr:PREDICTED: probable isoprenylcysteine alpha-carbonyl methylesterase ICMEL1 isoform X4 [Musa acuminata subsp. malaccensis]
MPPVALLPSLSSEPAMSLELHPHPPSPQYDEEEKASPSSSSSSASSPAAEDARPFLRRSASAAGGGGRSRRRRTVSEPSLRSLSSHTSRGRSLGRDVGHAAAETFLLTRLAITLLRYLGVGYRWITKFLALICYATLLMPGFLQVGYYYFFSSQVRRSIVYGDRPRNRLDLYLPTKVDGLKPVVAFVTGGAWIIGYKAWGALLGRRLAERGIIVACIDYRIYLIGQSAGAHIAACTILDQAIKECGERECTSWSVSQIKAYFGISGGYNMLELVDHFHSRGLYRSIFLSIMEGEQNLWRFSPEVLVQDSSIKHAISLLPHVILFHGTSDQSIPSTASKKFVDTLHGVGAKVDIVLFEGKTHTDLFLQDPLRGGKDELLEHIAAVIYGGVAAAHAHISVAPLPRRLVPEFMLQLARKISPF